MGNQVVGQAVLTTRDAFDPNQVSLQLATFDEDGVARPVPAQAAAQTDVGAVTSVVAAGANPTKAEYDALRVDALATRTVLNNLLAKLRTAGVIDT